MKKFLGLALLLSVVAAEGKGLNGHSQDNNNNTNTNTATTKNTYEQFMQRATQIAAEAQKKAAEAYTQAKEKTAAAYAQLVADDGETCECTWVATGKEYAVQFKDKAVTQWTEFKTWLEEDEQTSGEKQDAAVLAQQSGQEKHGNDVIPMQEVTDTKESAQVSSDTNTWRNISLDGLQDQEQVYVMQMVVLAMEANHGKLDAEQRAVIAQVVDEIKSGKIAVRTSSDITFN